MDADRRRGGSRPACTVVKTGVNVWWQAEMEAKTKFFTGSEQQTRHEYSHQMEQRRKQGMKMWKRAVRWKWYGHAGWSCSLRSSLPLCLSTSPPLSLSSGGWHFPSSVWPLTEGGMNGSVERGERAGWRGEGRMSSRRTSKCSPADLLGELGKKNVCAWKTWLETAVMQQYWTFRGGGGLSRIADTRGNIIQYMLLSGRGHALSAWPRYPGVWFKSSQACFSALLNE